MTPFTVHIIVTKCSHNVVVQSYVLITRLIDLQDPIVALRWSNLHSRYIFLVGRCEMHTMMASLTRQLLP